MSRNVLYLRSTKCKKLPHIMKTSAKYLYLYSASIATTNNDICTVGRVFHNRLTAEVMSVLGRLTCALALVLAGVPCSMCEISMELDVDNNMVYIVILDDIFWK